MSKPVPAPPKVEEKKEEGKGKGEELKPEKMDE